MLTCKDVVLVKSKDGKKVDALKTYTRTYYQLGEKDPVELKEVTVDGKAICEDGSFLEDKTGSPQLKVQKPKDTDKSVHDLAELHSQTVNAIQAKYPKKNPVFVMLSKYSYGDDLDERAKISQELRALREGPSKAVETAINKAMAVGLDRDTAISMLAKSTNPEVAAYCQKLISGAE